MFGAMDMPTGLVLFVVNPGTFPLCYFAIRFGRFFLLIDRVLFFFQTNSFPACQFAGTDTLTDALLLNFLSLPDDRGFSVS